MPHNGDVNPYGIVVIRHSHGRLRAGHVLISNFNNKANLQGTGTTMVEISPRGHRTLFAKINASTLPGPCPGGVGLTTALAVLRGGWVVVGSTPSRNGMAATAKAGCLIVLNNRGHVVETIAGHGINGPWDATSLNEGNQAALFVTNVLNGTVAAKGKVVHRGTVLRLQLRVFSNMAPQLLSTTKIGSGFPQQTNAAAFILGATGVGLSRTGALYVASTQNNQIRVIRNAVTRSGTAGRGMLLTAGGKLNNPLGLAVVAARQRADRERRQRAHRGDHAGRGADRVQAAGQLGQPEGRWRAVRPGRAAGRPRRLLRGRRRQHAAPAALARPAFAGLQPARLH